MNSKFVSDECFMPVCGSAVDIEMNIPGRCLVRRCWRLVLLSGLAVVSTVAYALPALPPMPEIPQPLLEDNVPMKALTNFQEVKLDMPNWNNLINTNSGVLFLESLRRFSEA